MSNRPVLISGAFAEVRRQQAAYDRFHDAVAGYLGLNRTDLRCLDLLELSQGLTPGELAEATGMSTGAVTAMLDRLERAGYVRRVRDGGDRRKVRIELTDQARAHAADVYEPLAAQAVPLSDAYSDEQLATIGDFLRTVTGFYGAQTTRVEGLSDDPRPRG